LTKGEVEKPRGKTRLKWRVKRSGGCCKPDAKVDRITLPDREPQGVHGASPGRRSSRKL